MNAIQQNDQAVSILCDKVMRGVVNTLTEKYIKQHDNQIDMMLEIMRNEVKSFMFESEYENERQSIINHSIHESYIVSLVIMNCVEKIKNI